MTKADQTVDSAADKLETLVREAQASGGIKAKVGEVLADDPAFVRKLKPSLIAARVKGETPPEDASATTTATPRAPSGPQLGRPKKPKIGRDLSPWLVIGAALAGGYLLAKVLDWRGHAHPRI
ncbi:MAG: hypothetical protein ACJ77E_02550 [Gaiellaceae bacterium]